MSYPEILLWQRLKGSPAGLTFRRQHPLGPDFTADFYCAAARLVIEVDGATHDGEVAQAHDAKRDAYVSSRGLETVRVAACDILRDAATAAQSIVTYAATPLHHRRKGGGGPPPRTGEEQGWRRKTVLQDAVRA